jgi:hypothetical protein
MANCHMPKDANVSYRLSAPANAPTVAELPNAPSWTRKPIRRAAIVIRKRR